MAGERDPGSRAGSAVDVETRAGPGFVEPGEAMADESQRDSSERAGRVRAKRLSRWDRRPEPHDWRWAVGHVGRALITSGLLMFGFVAYQLWGTGLQTAQAQNDLDSEFNEFFEVNGITPDTLAPAAVTTTIPTTIPTADTTADTSADTAPTAGSTDDTTTGDTVTTGATAPATTAGSTSGTTTDMAATLPPETTPTTAAPVVQDYGDVDPGEALAKLVIPSIDLNWKVVAGVSGNDLKKGPGHFPDTPLPGQLGNAAIAGHRTGHGGPFVDLDKLEPGDEIQVYTQIGGAYAYIVVDSVIVDPGDYEVISDFDPEVATLTLVTCTPKYSSAQRLVVRATLDPQRGSPVGLPLIFYGEDEPIEVVPELPADDATVDPSAESSDATSNTGSDTDSGTASGPVGGVESSVVVDTAASGPDRSVLGSGDAAGDAVDDAPSAGSAAPGATTAAGSVSNEFAGVDAFSQGWFDDNGAWPHIAGWAGLLALIAYGAFRLGKRFRRLWLAYLAGFAPFVLVLYFFYENVNRLLPAAI